MLPQASKQNKRTSSTCASPLILSTRVLRWKRPEQTVGAGQCCQLRARRSCQLSGATVSPTRAGPRQLCLATRRREDEPATQRPATAHTPPMPPTPQSPPARLSRSAPIDGATNAHTYGAAKGWPD